MLFVAELFLFALATLAWAPDSPLGKSLRKFLVEAPVRALEGITPLKVIVGLIAFLCVIGTAMAAPEIVAIIGIGDLSLYFDAAIIVMLLSALTRMKLVAVEVTRLGRTVVARIAASHRRFGARFSRMRRSRLKRLRPSDDDDTAGDWAFA